MSDISQGISYPRSFEDILADEEEIILPAKEACKVWFAEIGKGDITSSTLRFLEYLPIPFTQA